MNSLAVKPRWCLGRHWYFNLINDPKRFAFVLARYKLARELIPNQSSIIELGSSEGLGAPMLAENASKYLGVDLDKDAIETAKKNFKEGKYAFIEDDFMGKKYGDFDAAVSLDVIEHIYEQYEDKYFTTLCNNLVDNGLCLIGTPNITSAPYASKASQEGHVNLYDGKRLTEVMKKYFDHVFLFGINDEVSHFGYYPMTHYLFVLGCGKTKKGSKNV